MIQLKKYLKTSKEFTLRKRLCFAQVANQEMFGGTQPLLGYLPKTRQESTLKKTIGGTCATISASVRFPEFNRSMTVRNRAVV
jgi:hypothetical protein